MAAPDRTPAADHRQRRSASSCSWSAVFPVYWMVNTSLLPATRSAARTRPGCPFGGTLDNYRTVFEGDQFRRTRSTMSLIGDAG